MTVLGIDTTTNEPVTDYTYQEWLHIKRAQHRMANAKHQMDMWKSNPKLYSSAETLYNLACAEIAKIEQLAETRAMDRDARSDADLYSSLRIGG